MHLSLTFTPHWDLVEPIGELVSKACGVAIHNRSTVEQIGVAARELVENTVKYSDSGDAAVGLTIRDRNVQLVVENQPAQRSLHILLDEVAKLAASDDSLADYRRRMQIAAQHSPGKSGLGLARIRHECGMHLTAERIGNRVRMVAKRRS